MRHEIRTTRREELIDVTEVVARAVAATGVSAGIAVVSSPHTTAGILVNENADPDVATDLIAGLSRLAPEIGGLAARRGQQRRAPQDRPGRDERDGADRRRSTGARHVAGGVLRGVRRPEVAAPARDRAFGALSSGSSRREATGSDFLTPCGRWYKVCEHFAREGPVAQLARAHG